MADAQGRSPGDPGYDITTDAEVNTGGSAGGLGAGSAVSETPVKANTGGGLGAGSDAGQIPGSIDGVNAGPDEMGALSLLLTKYPNDPAQAVNAFNAQFPNSTLRPQYYADRGRGVIGVAGQRLPYLVAPGTNPGQTSWQFGGVPGGDGDPGGTTGGAVGSYSALTRPDAVASPYTPATWSETYKVPSVNDLLADPGYQSDAASMQRALEHSAAAKGTVLDGGFVGRALPRAMADFTSNAYTDLNNRNFQTYQSRYNQFLNANNAQLGARQLNENDYNADVTNNLNQYLTRYGSYQDLIKNNLAYARLGLDATQAGAPTAPGTGAV